MTNLATICPCGPFTLSGKFHLVEASVNPETDDGFNIVVASWEFSPGTVPTPADLEAVLVQAKSAVEQATGKVHKYLTRHQFAQHILAERTGGAERFAIPGPDIFTLDIPGAPS